MKTKLRYGLIGCGGFGKFCLESYRQMNNVTCVAVADSNVEMATQTAAENHVEYCASPAELIGRDDIDLIHLATPPFTHFELAKAALLAGKHVLCEKPLALNLEDAQSMIHLAAEKNRVLAVNLIMRYNPLCQSVKAVVDSKILGEPLFASLVNAAEDEKLVPSHWFWDRNKSGGIFVEHGVHFFDLFEWWFGKGTVLSGQQLHRPGTEFVDQVNAVVQYGDSTLGTFYHGFTQMKRRDQQSWRIVFELGTITMTEWVPTSLELNASLSLEGLETVKSLLPSSRVQILERYDGAEKQATSRHQSRTIDVTVSLTTTAGKAKSALYGDMVRDLLSDQIAAIQNKSHARLVSEANGLSSLAYACTAQAMADATQL